jgi:hypothetical protein
VEEHPTTQEEYVRRVLDAYRSTPGTAGTIRRADRLLATQLWERGVPLLVVENALILAVARRLSRPVEATPLNTVRSLAYFVPVIEEVAELRVNPDYYNYLRQKIRRHSQAR